MLKLPRRRPPYTSYSSSYYNQAKRPRKFSLLWLMLSLPLVLLLLELLARVFLTFMGNSDNLGKASPLVNAYRLKFVTANQKPIEGLANQGNLVAQRSASTGYQLVGNQKSQFLQINPQGFRDIDPVPLAKPKDEIRIFVLGGSTAFGQWNKNDKDIISQHLEALLQQRVTQQKNTPQKYRPDIFPFFKPDRAKLILLPAKIKEGKYRVINAAVPGYTSSNELAQVALQILPYQPDLIVILDGYADLMLPSSETQADIPHIDDFLQDPSGHFGASFGQSFNQWTKEIALAKTFDYLLFKPQIPVAEKTLVLKENNNSLAQQLPNDEIELKKRVTSYQENHKRIIQLAARAGIPVFIAIQPEITGRSPHQLAPEEKAILDQLGKDYLEKTPKAYSQFVQASQQLAKAFPKTVKVLNFYSGNYISPPAMFTDAIHLTEKGNSALAEKLYQNITTSEKIQIIPANFYLKK